MQVQKRAEMPPKTKGPLYLGGAAPRVALDVAEAIREEPEQRRALREVGKAAQPAGQPLRLSKAEFRQLPEEAKDFVERHPYQPPPKRRKSAAEEKKATQSRIQAAIRLLERNGYRVIAPGERKGNGGPLPPPPPQPPLPPVEEADEDQFGPGSEEEDGTLERLRLEMKMDWNKNINALLRKLKRFDQIPKAIETAMRAVAKSFPAILRGNSQRLNELEEGADGILVWVALQIDPYLQIPDKENAGVTAQEPVGDVLEAARQAIEEARAALQPPEAEPEDEEAELDEDEGYAQDALAYDQDEKNRAHQAKQRAQVDEFQQKVESEYKSIGKVELESKAKAYAELTGRQKLIPEEKTGIARIAAVSRVAAQMGISPDSDIARDEEIRIIRGLSYFWDRDAFTQAEKVAKHLAPKLKAAITEIVNQGRKQLAPRQDLKTDREALDPAAVAAFYQEQVAAGKVAPGFDEAHQLRWAQSLPLIGFGLKKRKRSL